MKKAQEEIEPQFIFKIKKRKISDQEISAHWNKVLACIKPQKRNQS